MTRLSWPPIIDRAAEIVESYDGGVTLRQLFYRLLSEGLIPNTDSAYKYLSSQTAEIRRLGEFPTLVDHTREIRQPSFWTSPKSAMETISRVYRRDRTKGQRYAIYLGAEKATMLNLLDLWFRELGFPVILLRGYGSQTYLDEISDHWLMDEREPLLIYAGDLDPSGEDIQRDFIARTFSIPWKIERIAVRFDQVESLGLIKQDVERYKAGPKKGEPKDPRAPAFLAKYGELFQIEIEAIEPNALNELYQSALDRYWDESIYREILAAEDKERTTLIEIANDME